MNNDMQERRRVVYEAFQAANVARNEAIKLAKAEFEEKVRNANYAAGLVYAEFNAINDEYLKHGDE